jgi:hypothetical protein
MFPNGLPMRFPGPLPPPEKLSIGIELNGRQRFGPNPNDRNFLLCDLKKSQEALQQEIKCFAKAVYNIEVMYSHFFIAIC